MPINIVLSITAWVTCKIRSLSRVGRCICWRLLKWNTNRSFLQIHLSLTSGHVHLCPRCGLHSVSADTEEEDRAALGLPGLCVTSAGFLQSVRFCFHAGHPQAAFHFPVSKRSAEDNLRPVGFLCSSCLKVQMLSDYCSCKCWSGRYWWTFCTFTDSLIWVLYEEVQNLLSPLAACSP